MMEFELDKLNFQAVLKRKGLISVTASAVATLFNQYEMIHNDIVKNSNTLYQDSIVSTLYMGHIAAAIYIYMWRLKVYMKENTIQSFIKGALIFRFIQALHRQIFGGVCFLTRGEMYAQDLLLGYPVYNIQRQEPDIQKFIKDIFTI